MTRPVLPAARNRSARPRAAGPQGQAPERGIGGAEDGKKGLRPARRALPQGLPAASHGPTSAGRSGGRRCPGGPCLLPRPGVTRGSPPPAPRPRRPLARILGRAAAPGSASEDAQLREGQVPPSPPPGRHGSGEAPAVSRAGGSAGAGSGRRRAVRAAAGRGHLPRPEPAAGMPPASAARANWMFPGWRISSSPGCGSHEGRLGCAWNFAKQQLGLISLRIWGEGGLGGGGGGWRGGTVSKHGRQAAGASRQLFPCCGCQLRGGGNRGAGLRGCPTYGRRGCKFPLLGDFPSFPPAGLIGSSYLWMESGMGGGMGLVTLRGEGKPSSPPLCAPLAAGCLRAPAAAGPSRSPRPQPPSPPCPSPESPGGSGPNRLPVRSVSAPGAAPAGRCCLMAGQGTAGPRAEAAPEAGEGLTPWLEGLPWGQRAFPESQPLGGWQMWNAFGSLFPLPAPEQQTAEEVFSPARQGWELLSTLWALIAPEGGITWHRVSASAHPA